MEDGTPLHAERVRRVDGLVRIVGDQLAIRTPLVSRIELPWHACSPCRRAVGDIDESASPPIRYPILAGWRRCRGSRRVDVATASAGRRAGRALQCHLSPSAGACSPASRTYSSSSASTHTHLVGF